MGSQEDKYEQIGEERHPDDDEPVSPEYATEDYDEIQNDTVEQERSFEGDDLSGDAYENQDEFQYGTGGEEGRYEGEDSSGSYDEPVDPHPGTYNSNVRGDEY